MTRVLIVEDEEHLARGLRFNFEAEGYDVEVAGDGETALERLLAPDARFDAVVLDVMLPGRDGFAVAAELRRQGQLVPILMLTARSRPQDVVRGFESGADDYLTKPFELAILVARVRGLLRRHAWSRGSEAAGAAGAAESDAGTGAPSEGPAATAAGAAGPDAFSFAGKTIDFERLELRAGDRSVRLTLMEADLLRHLARNEGKVVSRKALLEEVWGLREDTDTRAIDNFLVRLRRYVEDEPTKPRHLLTVRGVGYRFVAEPDAKA